MSDAEGDDERRKPKGVFSTLVANGAWLYQKGEYKKAIESYTTALTLKPGDTTCFVGRSKCYLKMGQYERALEDADASIDKDKTFFEGLYQKAEVLYLMGEFQSALVFYHRGQRIRPHTQMFRLGIQKAEEAIENSVGRPEDVKTKIKEQLVLQKDARNQPIAAVEHLTREKNQKIQKTPKKEKTTRKLLREFYTDQKYLEGLLKDKNLVKSKMKNGDNLKDVIEETLAYLDICTEFWNQECPETPEKEKKMNSKGTSSSPRMPAEPAEFLLKSLEDIDEELTSGNAKSGLKKAEEVLKTVQGWSEKEFPNKKEVLGNLHGCIGNAWIELGKMDRALEHHHKGLELAEQCKLPEATSRALDSIGRVYAQMGEFQQAIQVWEKKIPLVRGDLEKTWLFHEIGWCYLELGRHEDARDYGVRSAAAADETADEKWQINANVLVAQSQLKLGNMESSVSYFEKALNLARRHQDSAIINAIQKALDEVEQH
ncbi:outer dynein arm-docking complex subunit 4 [Takifugu flavidus]|uniref:outer dynein arm-docking complex subunit 4 n=1 Tax=Takifugu flavidus TaxID=433684 RepID=UPI002544992B|nr:outer dynein arm-docking complex subunit 4 [Takifugu flavidus]